MRSVKNIGVREFRNNASTYLSGPDVVADNRHGKVIGFDTSGTRTRSVGP